MKGIVKWFKNDKGYGFISPLNGDNSTGGKDVFVHHTSIRMDGYRTLNAGDRVTFEVEEGERGLYAVEVEKVD